NNVQTFTTRRSSDLKGHELGLISEDRYKEFQDKKQAISQAMEAIKKVTIHPTDEVQEYLASVKQDRLNAGVSGADFLKRPRVTLDRKSTRLNSSHVS